jgi:hypothetical protein
MIKKFKTKLNLKQKLKKKLPVKLKNLKNE